MADLPQSKDLFPWLTSLREAPPEKPGLTPFSLFRQGWDYWVDACQRSILLADILRQRGNEHYAYFS